MAQDVDLAPALWLTTSISGVPTDAGGQYDSGALNYLLQALRGTQSGVVTSGDLQVTAQSPTAGAKVLVSPGGCWIPGTSSPSIQGVYLVRSPGQVTLDVPAASSSIARNDIIVARVLDAKYDGSPVAGVSYRARISYIAGNQTTGAAPAMPANSYLLAKVVCPAGSSTVVATANITNVGALSDLGVGGRPRKIYDNTLTANGAANTGWSFPVPSGDWGLLKVRVDGQSVSTANGAPTGVTLNNDAGANYYGVYHYGYDSGVTGAANYKAAGNGSLNYLGGAPNGGFHTVEIAQPAAAVRHQADWKTFFIGANAGNNQGLLVISGGFEHAVNAALTQFGIWNAGGFTAGSRCQAWLYP